MYDPKVSATTLKHDLAQNTPKVIKYPNKHCNYFSKQLNSPIDTVAIAIGLGKRLAPKLSPTMKDNAP